MATVAELYQEVLGRAPDPEGLAYWTQRLGNNVDAAGEGLFTSVALAQLKNLPMAEQIKLAPNLVNSIFAGGDASGGSVSAGGTSASPPPTTYNSYLEELKQTNPAAYNKTMSLGQYTANENFGGKIQDYQAQIFSPLNLEKAGIPKQLEFTEPTLETYVDANEETKTRIKQPQVKNPGFTENKNESGQVESYSSPMRTVNGLPINAYYDTNGKLIEVNADSKVVSWLNGNQYAIGKWDAQGNPTTITQTSGGGGDFLKSIVPAVGLIAAAYGVPAISDAISAGGLFSGTGATAIGAGADAAFVAADAAQLAAQGLSQAAIEQNLIGAGVDSFLAADAAQLAAQGIGKDQMTGLLSQSASNTPIFPATSPTNIPNPSTPPSSGNTPPVAPSVIPPITSAITGAGTGSGILDSAIGKAVTGSVVGSVLGGAGGSTGGGLLQGGANLVGNVVQSEADKAAQLKAQQDILAATQQATTGAQFRPVGVTTKFGSSQFQIDPKTGQLVSAGYTASPEITSAQNQLMQLGAGYLAQTPEQVAQQYLAKQYDLIDPSRQRQLADIRNQNLQTGRGGLSVGSTGLRPSGAQGLMGTNPELEAYYNALAQQDATLAANAQLAGQQQVTYGAGLFGQAGNLESLAQQPFTLGTGLGTAISNAGANAGRLTLTGVPAAASYGTNTAATTNPYATILGGLTSPTSALGQGIANWLTSNTPVSNVGGSGNVFNTGYYDPSMQQF